MGQMSAAYHQSMEEYGRKWFRPKWFREGHEEGRDEGIRQGRDEGVRQGRDEGIRQERREHVRVLFGKAQEKFGREVAEELVTRLSDTPNPEQLLDAAVAVASCGTGDELLNRVRSLPNG